MELGGATPLTASRLNHIEDGIGSVGNVVSCPIKINTSHAASDSNIKVYKCGCIVIVDYAFNVLGDTTWTAIQIATGLPTPVNESKAAICSQYPDTATAYAHVLSDGSFNVTIKSEKTLDWIFGQLVYFTNK